MSSLPSQENTESLVRKEEGEMKDTERCKKSLMKDEAKDEMKKVINGEGEKEEHGSI